MSLSLLTDRLDALTGGLVVEPLTSPEGVVEWDYHLRRGDSPETLHPDDMPEFMATRHPVIYFSYGGGSAVYLVRVSDLTPAELAFASDENSHEWEMHEFDSSHPYLLIDDSASGDVLESLADLSEATLRMVDRY